jgi:hypothetical protein
MNQATPRFKVGTTFYSRGKHPRLCTVTDYLVTRNLAGEVVKARYVATHDMCGQDVVDVDVPEVAIAMGLIQAAEGHAPDGCLDCLRKERGAA